MAKEEYFNCIYKDVCTSKCNSFCIRFSEMNYLLTTSGIPVKKQHPIPLIPEDCDYDSFCDLAHFKDTILDKVASGANLYICSTETGNGKTTWAIKILLKYFDSIWAGNGYRPRGMFVHVPSLLLKLKDFKNELSTDVQVSILPEVDIVIWDDIAGSKLSDYDITQLLSLIDKRVLNEKSNIFTGNLVSYKMLENSLGSRLASRVWNSSEVVQLNGKDKRSS